MHETNIATLPMPTRYLVECKECGVVGKPQEYRADAEAIAARHTEVGGFEVAPR